MFWSFLLAVLVVVGTIALCAYVRREMRAQLKRVTETVSEPPAEEPKAEVTPKPRPYARGAKIAMSDRTYRVGEHNEWIRE